MGKLIDLTGRKFGKLTVLYRNGVNRCHSPLWVCQCDCGQIHSVSSACLLHGGTQSCGCKRKETFAKIKAEGKREYRALLRNKFRGMHKRCYDPSCISYSGYGGMGITVCDEWHDWHAFFEWASTHGFKKGLQLDRIDPTRGYSPDNCRFVTPSENNNNRRTTVFVEVRGEKLPLSVVAEKYNLSLARLHYRVKAGYVGEELISQENFNFRRKK